MPVLPGAFTHSYLPLFLPLHRSRRSYLWSAVHGIHASPDHVAGVFVFAVSLWDWDCRSEVDGWERNSLLCWLRFLITNKAFSERSNYLEKENPPGDLLSLSLWIWGTCETVNLVTTSPPLLNEKVCRHAKFLATVSWLLLHFFTGVSWKDAMCNALSRILTEGEPKKMYHESPSKNSFRCSEKVLREHLAIEKIPYWA